MRMTVQYHRFVCRFSVLLMVAVMWAALASSAQAFEESELTIDTATGTHAFMIEIARTSQEQALGLMHRRALAPDFAMLFPFERARESSFWMRDTYVSLDMVFIAEGGIVHRIERDTEPLSLRPVPSRGPVVAVLEFVAGTADRIGLAPGDKINHDAILGVE